MLGAPAEVTDSTLRQPKRFRAILSGPPPNPAAAGGGPTSRAGGAGSAVLSDARGQRECRFESSTDRCARAASAPRGDPPRDSANASRKHAAGYAVRVLSERRLSWNSA